MGFIRFTFNPEDSRRPQRLRQSPEGEWVRFDAAQAEITRLTAERDHWKRIARHAGVCMTCQGPNGAPEPYGCSDCLNTGWSGEYHNGLTDAENELNQALAQAASAATDMRKRAAATYAMYSGVDLTKRLLSLPIDPDAQKALDKMLARARGNAIREAEEALLDADQTLMLLGDKGWRNRHDAILALLNDGGRDDP